MNKVKAQYVIIIFWFISSGLLGVLFILLQILKKFGDFNNEAWEWYTQTILPNSSLMLGSLLTNNHQDQTIIIRKGPYSIALGLSVFYFFLILLTLFTYPITATGNETLIQRLDDSSIYLTLFQGINAVSLGYFFNECSS